VRLDAVGGTQRYVTMGGESFLLRSQADDDLQFLLTTDGQHRSLVADRGAVAGAWMHVVGTWDGTTQRLYKDGAVVASQKPGGTLAAFRKLTLSNGGGEGMKGLLDDVRVYGRALTDADVQSLHAAGLAGTGALEERPWQPIWDGKTTGFLGGGSENEWKVEGGVLVRNPGSRDAAQSREEYGDGEFRLRFEAAAGTTARFSFRQGGDGNYTVHADGSKPAGKPVELLVTCRGDEVKALLDGQPAAVEAEGKPARGHLQISFNGPPLRIHSVEMRPLP
jgi:hypothetical protein